MKLASVYATNFLSFHHLDLPLQHNGLTLVTGENRDDPTLENNGSGKTNAMEAISWGLYGKCMKSERSDVTVDDVANDLIKKNCSVIVHGWLDGGEQFQISRYRKDGTFKNKLLLHIKGEDKSKADNDDTQKYIEDLIGADFSVFIHSRYYGQGGGTQLAGMRDSEVKKILDDVMNVRRFSKARDVVAARLKWHRAAMDAERSTLTSNTARVETLRESIERMKAGSAKSVAEQKAAIEREIAEIDKELENYFTAAKYEEEIAMRETAQKLNAEEERKCELQIDSLRADAMDIMGQLSSQKKLHTEVQRQIDRLKHLKPMERCTSCGSLINEKNKAATEKHLKEEVAKHLEQIEALEKQRMELDGKVNEVRGRMAVHEGQVTAYGNELDRYRKNQDEMLQLKSNRKMLYRKQAEVKATAFGDELKEAKEELSKTEFAVKECERRIAQTEGVVTDLEFWLEGFGLTGIRSFLLDSVCPFLTEESTRIARILADGALRIEWLPVDPASGRDNLTFKTLYDHGSDKYGLQSGAERGRVDFPVRGSIRALAQSMGGSINFSIYDEPFAHMDKSLMDKVIEMLAEEAKSVENVFLITQDSRVMNNPLFQTRFKVVKENGLSSLTVL